MIQLQDVTVYGWYKERLMTFYMSKYNSYLTEYEHNKEKLKKTYRSKNLDIKQELPCNFPKKSTESRFACMFANCGDNVLFITNVVPVTCIIDFAQK